ncbi:DUF3558 domain-containing protein [Saccharomonospora xinjiangensis]|uniref:DUF3558 domain-containing protein n=1 Tax=Saccharomonospora xinjiangensis TaxID=75294 RepID=UPI00106FDB54|nr:DUF3558 domain-containing protein [Saccharomonospora xinjiangensis]
MPIAHRTWSLLAATFVILSVSGCSSEKIGVAGPPVAPTGSADDTAGATTATTAAAEPISTALDPCAILPGAELSKYGEFEPEYDEGGGARICYWHQSAEGGNTNLTFGISVRDAQNIDSVNDNGAGVQRTEINQRPAAVAKNPQLGNCTLAMKLDEISRVDVTVPDLTGPDEECEVAEVIAEFVEPHLPDVR